MSSRGPPTSSYRPAHSRGAWTTPKRMIYTGAFAAVAIVGSIYGAGLKTQQEYKAEKKKIVEAPVEERIQALEARRAQLVSQRRPLEQKLEELRLRVQKQQQQQQPGGDAAAAATAAPPPQETSTSTTSTAAKLDGRR